jgi:hypothetical protein
VKAALDDYRTSPLRPAARAALGLIEKLVRAPQDVVADDIRAVRDAGASDEAIRDALYVATTFGVLVRLADALGWRVPPRESFEKAAKFLLPNGYAFPAPLALAARLAALGS